MGCHPSRHLKYHFNPKLKAKLEPLSQQYTKVLLFIRSSTLFTSYTELKPLVDIYLQNFTKTNHQETADMAMISIDAVHKLQPVDYGTQFMTSDKLTSACIRHQKFASEFPVENMSFEKSREEYLEFLYLCSKNEDSFMVPSQMGFFMWHSHMQDHEAYLHDCHKILGRVLNHTDDVAEKDLVKYRENTQKIRQILIGSTTESKLKFSKQKQSESTHLVSSPTVPQQTAKKVSSLSEASPELMTNHEQTNVMQTCQSVILGYKTSKAQEQVLQSASETNQEETHEKKKQEKKEHDKLTKTQRIYLSQMQQLSDALQKQRQRNKTTYVQKLEKNGQQK